MYNESRLEVVEGGRELVVRRLRLYQAWARDPENHLQEIAPTLGTSRLDWEAGICRLDQGQLNEHSTPWARRMAVDLEVLRACGEEGEGLQELLQKTKKHLRGLQKFMRQVRRVYFNWLDQVRGLELIEAHKAGRHHDVHHTARLIAGTGVGVTGRGLVEAPPTPPTPNRASNTSVARALEAEASTAFDEATTGSPPPNSGSAAPSSPRARRSLAEDGSGVVQES